MMQTAFSFAPLFIVHTAIKLNIFDHLAKGGKTAAELQSVCQASSRGIEALLDALVGLEWLDKDGPFYELNSESEDLLVRNRPSYSGDIFDHFSYHSARVQGETLAGELDQYRIHVRWDCDHIVRASGSVGTSRKCFGGVEAISERGLRSQLRGRLASIRFLFLLNFRTSTTVLTDPSQLALVQG